jgi:hypothetical protein
MSYIDLDAALREWGYEPERISVRKIVGADGAVRIQMRVELGVLQMYAEGRPDGAQPHGWPTLLTYHQKRLTRHQQRNGTPLGFGLSQQECYDLRLEASLFYRRYIALFVLEEYAGVAMDTSHSLGIFDMCREHALEPEDRAALEEFRPYVMMMDARARAYQSIEQGQVSSALAHINRGIMAINAHYESFNQLEIAAKAEEIKILRALMHELSAQAPKDSLVVTKNALRAAIEQERFEEAARLRDAIKDRNHTES